MLSQQEITELCKETGFNTTELKRIYSRFRKLDYFNRGYVTIHDLATIPDFDKNPLGDRITRVLSKEGSGIEKNTVDFREFVKALAVFNGTSSTLRHSSAEDEKIRFLFRVYDTDSDGYLSREDLLLVMKKLVANSLTDAQLQSIVDKTIKDLDGDRDGLLTFEEFKRLFDE